MRDVLTWLPFLLACVGWTVTYLLYRAGQARTDGRAQSQVSSEMHDRVVKLETQMELLLGGMIRFAGTGVHSPHADFREIDALIDKLQKNDLSEPEIARLLGLLEVIIESGPADKVPAAELMLTSLRARYMYI